MSKDCPSSFALDAFRLGLDRTPATHVEGCPRCTAWLAAQAQVEAQVAQLWVPAPPRPRRVAQAFWRWARLGLPITAAGVAVLLFVVRPRPPTQIAKGSSALAQVALSQFPDCTLVSSFLSPEDNPPQINHVEYSPDGSQPSGGIVVRQR